MQTSSTINQHQINILRWALGIHRQGATVDSATKNFFTASEGTADYQDAECLVDLGYMRYGCNVSHQVKSFEVTQAGKDCLSNL